MVEQRPKGKGPKLGMGGLHLLNLNRHGGKGFSDKPECICDLLDGSLVRAKKNTCFLSADLSCPISFGFITSQILLSQALM